ncbi:MAG: NAD(P)-dependent oxidoreductase [Verrucomicrobiota bacterium]
MKRLRIAVTGTTGRVGAALAKHLAGAHEIIRLPRTVFDLADRANVSAVLSGLNCDVFLNPAGITSLEACEDDPPQAMRVNSQVPGRIAEWCSGNNVRMIHFSTDYVFDGKNGRLLTENDKPAPLSAYGRSKLAGERAVLAFPGHSVLRVSWVFGPEKPSFIDSVFHSALADESLAAVADKTSLPTHTADLCGWAGDLLEKDFSGMLHACNAGEPASWHDIAMVVADEMLALGILKTMPEIVALRMRDVTAFRAPRPVHSAMDSSALAGLLGRTIRPWPEAVRGYVRELAAAYGSSTSAITGK